MTVVRSFKSSNFVCFTGQNVEFWKLRNILWLGCRQSPCDIQRLLFVKIEF